MSHLYFPTEILERFCIDFLKILASQKMKARS